MNIARSITTWLFGLGLTGSISFGAGVTYPDLTVSPFAPAFFGIGHLDPYRGSEANGVAAQGGVFYGAVGIVNQPSVKGAPGYEAIFSRGNSPFYLPGSGDVANSSAVWAITPDGKIMVGFKGGPSVWDAVFEQRHLPYPGGGYGYGADLLAVSADGTAAVGYGATTLSRQQGARWPLDGSPPTLLGLIDGYDSTLAQGISADGGVICGRAFNTAEAIRNGAPDHVLALRKVFTSPWEVLEPVAGYTDSVAFGVKDEDDIILIAGQSFNRATGGSTACFWRLDGRAFQLSAFDRINTYESAAYAVSSTGIFVGEMGHVGEMEAVLWYVLAPDRIAGLLSYPYRVPVGKWRLTRATGISADGYTVCGVGVNPEGKIEGWVAILPPILYPPLLDPIPPQRAELDKPFFFELTGGRFTLAVRFSAKNLPDGFQIDSITGKITGTWDITKARPGDYTVTVSAAEPTQGTTHRSFTLTLPPPTSVKQLIEGHSYLPYAKPPGEPYFPTSFGLGLSGDGQVAIGYSGPNNDPRAYRWSPGAGMQELPALDGALFAYTRAEGASADGQVIVGQGVTAPDQNGVAPNVAVRWSVASVSSSDGADAPAQPALPNVTVMSLGFIPGGTSSSANDVSADGTVIVGHGSDYNPDVKGSGIRQAFRWTAAQGMVGLGWLPGGFLDSSTALAVSADGSVVVGGSSSANGSEAFRWTVAEGMKGLGILSGASFSRATGISGDGNTIIGHNGFSNHNRAFRWTAAEGMIELGTLPGHNVSEANFVSFDGSVIVGRSTVDFNPSRAFIWDKVNGMRDLKDVLLAGNPNLTGWTLHTAESISADGQTVAGYGINPNGDTEGFTAFLEAKPAQLLNISTRMQVLTGDRVLIGGFIITGNQPKKVIIRGIGPSLSGVGGALLDPTLELHQGNATLLRNDNWKRRTDGSSQQLEVEATTIPPAHDLEAAIVTTLAPGSYTAILAGNNGSSGIGVVEVYDLAQGANAKLANISSRGFVDIGDNVMIGGLIAGGGLGGGDARVIVRAIGPSLGSLGVSDALQDPVVELHNSSGTTIASNDDWKLRPDGSSQQAEIEATTIAPKDDRESALVASLPFGNYTAIVRGANNTTGIAVVEAYNLP